MYYVSEIKLTMHDDIERELKNNKSI